ncbi:hypothetical protein FRB99_007579 [Tulasnella sp. 403]|nr:hypothetical protein FRB99_007579 [Tulasnella sp. 403]
MAGITFLPFEVLHLILNSGGLTPRDWLALALTSRAFCALILDFTTFYYQNNPRPSQSLARAITKWSPIQRARYQYFSDRNWDSTGRVVSKDLVSLQGFARFAQTASPRPIMAVNEAQVVLFSALPATRLVFTPPKFPGGGTHFTRETALREEYSPALRPHDVTGATFVPDGGQNETLCVATSDGRIVRLRLASIPAENDSSYRHPQRTKTYNLRMSETARYPHPSHKITSLISSGNTLFSLAQHPPGNDSVTVTLASLYSIRSPWIPPQHLLLPGTSESALLSLSASTPFVAIGSRHRRPTAGRCHNIEPTNLDLQTPTTHPCVTSFSPYAPLLVHAVTPSSINPTPIAHLSHPRDQKGRKRINAPYALCSPSPASPFGSSPEIIVSGWYDGAVHIHDLRAQDTSTTASSGVSPLNPTLCFQDMWTDDPIYSIGMGGGHGSYIVAGLATHGVVEIFDVRNSSRAVGVHSPGGSFSSVYALHVEGSRIWGLSNRLFLLDFGPDARSAPGAQATTAWDLHLSSRFSTLR